MTLCRIVASENRQMDINMLIPIFIFMIDNLIFFNKKYAIGLIGYIKNVCKITGVPLGPCLTSSVPEISLKSTTITLSKIL